MSDQLAGPIEGETNDLDMHVNLCGRRYRELSKGQRILRARLKRVDRRVSRKLNWVLLSIVALLVAIIGDLVVAKL